MEKKGKQSSPFEGNVFKRQTLEEQTTVSPTKQTNKEMTRTYAMLGGGLRKQAAGNGR